MVNVLILTRVHAQVQSRNETPINPALKTCTYNEMANAASLPASSTL